MDESRGQDSDRRRWCAPATRSAATWDGNSAQGLVFDNRVTGTLQADNNIAMLDVVGNTVGATLQGQNNTMLVMGGMNTATQMTGRCN